MIRDSLLEATEKVLVPKNLEETPHVSRIITCSKQNVLSNGLLQELNGKLRMRKLKINSSCASTESDQGVSFRIDFSLNNILFA